MMGSWMGDLLGIASVQGCVCVLTSQMELYVTDVERRLERTIPLALSREVRVGAGNAPHSKRSAPWLPILERGRSASEMGWTPVLCGPNPNGGRQTRRGHAPQLTLNDGVLLVWCLLYASLAGHLQFCMHRHVWSVCFSRRAACR